MPTLNNLPGLKRVKTDCVFIDKASEIKDILTHEIACTSAGTKGAINIWVDDEGGIRGEAMRFCRTIEEQTFVNMDDMQKWASKWLKRIK